MRSDVKFREWFREFGRMDGGEGRWSQALPWFYAVWQVHF
jgi:hypothetical protein